MADRAETEAVLRRLIEVYWNEQRLDEIASVFAPEAVLHFGGVDYVGHEGIGERFARPFVAAFPDLRFEVLDLMVDDDRAAMRYRGEGHMARDWGGARASGQSMRYEGLALFHLKDARLVEVWSTTDLGDWLAAQPRA